jgi:hypothetical protein
MPLGGSLSRPDGALKRFLPRLHRIVTAHSDRQTDLQWFALFLDSPHEGPNMLTDQWRLVADQRRQVHFETNLKIVKRDACESTMRGASRKLKVSLASALR